MTLVTEISFRTNKRYERMPELLERLGLEKELMNDYTVRSAKTESGAYPRVTFTHTKGIERGIFLSPEAERQYKLHLPNNHALYNKVYGILRAKKVRFEPKLVDMDDISLRDEHLELLKPYD